MQYDLAIVGGGIAGYSAALTAHNLKVNYIWFADGTFGEKTAKAEYVRNFPAFTGNGKQFCAALEKQRQKEGVRFTEKRIDGVFRMGRSYTLTCGSETFEAQTVILATGVEARKIAGESEYLGRGVSYCAVCDGALYKNKTVAAVLSSEKFCEEVEYLASFASTVHCFCPFVHTFEHENVAVHHERVTGVSGEKRVEEITTDKGRYPVDGVFFLMESVPPSALCGGLKCEGESVVTQKDGSTNLKGLFAAGDLTGRPYQYVKAAGEGLVAVYSAAAYLKRVQAEAEA